ncbi:MAG: hypothetical protein H5T64_01800 [Chloroflexi bacterium]|nr:hypothetical protein [Chloroflexota bacterium]
MKTRMFFGVGLCLALLLILAVGLSQAQAPVPQGEATTLATPVGTAFTYQGRLIKDGNPVNGTADIQFSLWDAAAGGTQIGTTQTKTNVNVTNGVFTIPDLDFGATAFQGDARWLQIAVRSPAGSGSYTTLTPRQALTAAPYALSLRPGAVISGTAPAVTGRAGDAIGHLGTIYIASIWPPIFYPLGVYGAGTWGVYGYSTSAVGVYGTSAGSSGTGVMGLASAVTGTTKAVYGKAQSPDGYGGYFENAATGGVGLYCRGYANADADLVLGGTSSANDDGRIYSDPAYPNSDILLFSNDEYHLHLDEDNNSTSTFGIYNGVNTRVFWVDEAGNMTASGAKSAVVAAGEYGTRKMYAIESTGVWFEDFGSAQLQDGVAIVEIDPVFAATVNLEVGYHVFLTPVDGWASLYVANKTPTSFEVRDAEGKANIAFDYRIVAKRAGYEDVRMEPMALTLEDEQ